MLRKRSCLLTAHVVGVSVRDRSLETGHLRLSGGGGAKAFYQGSCGTQRTSLTPTICQEHLHALTLRHARDIGHIFWLGDRVVHHLNTWLDTVERILLQIKA